MKYNIKGKIIDDESSTPILGVEVSYNSNIVTTDSNGKFKISGELEDNEVITLNINKSGYSFKTIKPYYGDGGLKTNLSLVSLTPSKTNLEKEKFNLLHLDNDLVKTISKSGGSSNPQNKSLNKVVNTLKSFLIPTILTLISSFGVTNISKLLNKDITSPSTQCPDENELKNIINKRNKLAKQLNNLYKTIDTTIKALTLLEGIVITTKTTFSILKNLPVPTPPPGLPSLVPKIQDLKSLLEKNIEKFSKINSGTIMILLVLRDTLNQIIALLSKLDGLIQECAEGVDLDSINQELLDINKEQALIEPPTVVVNGFSFNIQTETTTSSLKRKRAVAENKQGIILLKGEYSYSVSDKILIDELIFHIQTNNLKAD